MRTARILSMACYVGEAPDQKAANLAMVRACLERAAAYAPDFVCFPEIVLQQRMSVPQAIDTAEPVPGPATEAVADAARALRAHVVFPMVERRGNRAYNAAVLLGPDGDVAGVYHKYHATAYEMADGISPGCDVPVWSTDKGRVGAAICFDLKFPEVGLRLSRGRANVTFWPSMFPGGLRLRSWAMDYGMYMVKCTAGSAEVHDPAGERVASDGQPLDLGVSDARLRITFAVVNTDRKSYHLDYNAQKLPGIMGRYGGGVEVVLCRPEGFLTLASRMDDVTVEDIEREFEMEDLRDYLDGAAAVREQKLTESQSE